MNYYEHHLGDWIRDTAHLSMTEEGAYRRLVDLYYTREAQLPGFKECCRLVRASREEEVSAVKTVLEEFFTVINGGYHHKRCDAEITHAKAKRDSAQRSANARWTHKRTECESDANAMPTQCEGNALQTPDSSNHKEEDVRKVFDHWRETHGHQSAKLDDKRRKLIASALKLYDADTLRRSISGYKQSEWHQGKNKDGKVYDGLSLILRDAQHIDDGLKYSQGGQQKWL